MSHNVIDLQSWSDPVVANRLRELLQRVEAGEIVGIAIVTHEKDDGVGTVWGRDSRGRVSSLVYGCELLKARLLGLVSHDD
jgi:hypothetical protein